MYPKVHLTQKKVSKKSAQKSKSTQKIPQNHSKKYIYSKKDFQNEKLLTKLLNKKAFKKGPK